MVTVGGAAFAWKPTAKSFDNKYWVYGIASTIALAGGSLSFPSRNSAGNPSIT